jgi:hypothetical protein
MAVVVVVVLALLDQTSQLLLAQKVVMELTGSRLAHTMLAVVVVLALFNMEIPQAVLAV